MNEELAVTKKDIIALIRYKKSNTFLNHLWTVFSGDFGAKGEVNENSVIIWNQTNWNRTFYPVFKFEFDRNQHLIKIADKLNPVAKAFFLVFVFGLLYALFIDNFGKFDLGKPWPVIIIFTVFIFLLSLFFRMIYRFEKKNQLDEIFELLDIEIEEKKRENEWSLKNILIRLFTYPFCLFLIWLNITLVIPDGNYKMAVGLFVFVGFYLVMDLKMIFKKDKV